MAFTGWLTPFATPWPIWAAVAGAVVISAILGALLEYAVIRPMAGDPVPTIGATLGLYLLVGVFVVKHFGGRTRFLGSPFPQEHSDRFLIADARLWFDSIGLTLTMLGALGVLAPPPAHDQDRAGLPGHHLQSGQRRAGRRPAWNGS